MIYHTSMTYMVISWGEFAWHRGDDDAWMPGCYLGGSPDPAGEAVFSCFFASIEIYTTEIGTKDHDGR